MHVRPIVLVQAAAFLAVAGCDGRNEVALSATSTAHAVTEMACADAPKLRQRALDDRRQSGEATSDQQRIVIGSRASVLASLAIIADLRCRVTSAEAEEAMKPLFEAVRRAEDTNSFYERAFAWGDANFYATQAVEILVRDLSALSAE